MLKRIALIAFLCIVSSGAVSNAADVKDADLAGIWYPSSKEDLGSLLQGYLTAANPKPIDGKIFAIISPHAGYNFSGPVAAYGFKALQGKPIKTVIILGFSHRQPFNGISIYSEGVFRTPLGDMPVDKVLAAAMIQAAPQASFNPAVFDKENSIEMQIPFIQTALGRVSIVPIVFGAHSFEGASVLADLLVGVLKGREDCIIVASTDLSHYYGYAQANEMDSKTVSLIEKMKARELCDSAHSGARGMCGMMPVVATLLAAERLGFTDVKILKYANSGDTSGKRDSVVGYVSAVICKKDERAIEPKTEDAMAQPKLNDAQKKRLLEIARDSITTYLLEGKRKTFSESDPVLNEERGAFVTFYDGYDLRGCIGQITGRGPLYKAVAEMAIESATRDPRFEEIAPEDIHSLEIEVSVLSPLKKVAGPDDIKIPGDGVVVRRGSASGIFLPQVAVDTGWSKEQFLTMLCAQKAGISPEAWKDPKTELFIFTAEVMRERDFYNKSRR